MSNHKAGENPARRIPKVSHATSIGVGLVGPKARPHGVADGQQVNIPAPRVHRPREEFDSFTGLCLCHCALECGISNIECRMDKSIFHIRYSIFGERRVAQICR